MHHLFTRRTVFGTLVVLTLLLPSCTPTTEEGDTIVNITDPNAQATSATNSGWNAFEAKQYRAAAAAFRQAIQASDQFADAYNGLGWTYARLDSLELSLRYFDIALGQQPAFLDAFAGRAFVSLALGDYRSAIRAASAVEYSGAQFYTFRHDVDITMDDLLLVEAQSHFMLSEYPAAQLLIDRLHPGNTLDPQSASYVEDMALELESLSGSL